MSRRILFAIRSKLGDTLISYACVRAFADSHSAVSSAVSSALSSAPSSIAHPQDQITLLTRSAYAGLLQDEMGIRIVQFNSRIEMFFKLMWLRFTEPAFDVLAVLWGSGAPVKRIGQWTKARRKIAWNKKFAPAIFEAGTLPAEPLLSSGRSTQSLPSA